MSTNFIVLRVLNFEVGIVLFHCIAATALNYEKRCKIKYKMQMMQRGVTF